jgi:hypothetical protein
MNNFIYGTQLNLELENLIIEADNFLWFISPYIKLHDRIKQELRRKLDNHRLEIVIVFGKNETDMSKSISLDDVNLLKQFPNVTICYEKTLHAKFYASEDACLITSMNLHQFSQNTNIEAGVVFYTKSKLKKLANMVTDTIDTGEHAIAYFEEVISHSEILFEKKPEYESGFLSSTYKGSMIIKDNLNAFFHAPKSDYRNPRPNSFSEAYKEGQDADNKTVTLNNNKQEAPFKPGFCIRTGVPIPFNPEKPLSNPAYKSWAQFNNPNFPENYCHFSGEPSNKETSVSKPILKKNWNKAKEWNA